MNQRRLKVMYIGSDADGLYLSVGEGPEHFLLRPLQVSLDGVPVAGQVAVFADASNIEGVDDITIHTAALRAATATALAAPAITSVTPMGTTGATTYTYKAVDILADGSHTEASAAKTTTTGNATLTGTNKNRLVLPARGAQVASRDIYRTAGGATQGKIGNTAALSFDDTGLAGDSATAPTTNTTARVTTPLIRGLVLAAHADNAAALAAGLVAGDLYYTDDAGEHVLKIVHAA